MLLPPILYIDGDSIWIETGGKLRVYGRRRFRDAGRTGRGEETRVATLHGDVDRFVDGCRDNVDAHGCYKRLSQRKCDVRGAPDEDRIEEVIHVI